MASRDNPPTEEIVVITDMHGRVVAAQLPTEESAGTDEAPVGKLAPRGRQRIHKLNIHREALQLAGPELHRYLSEITIHPDGEAELPEVEIERPHDLELESE